MIRTFRADSTAGLPTAVYGLKCVFGVPVEAFTTS